MDPALSKHSYQNINLSNDKCKYYTTGMPDTIHPDKIIFINTAQSPWLSYEPENWMVKKPRYFWKKYRVQKPCRIFQPSRRRLKTLRFVLVLHEWGGGCAAQGWCCINTNAHELTKYYSPPAELWSWGTFLLLEQWHKGSWAAWTTGMIHTAAALHDWFTNS